MIGVIIIWIGLFGTLVMGDLTDRQLRNAQRDCQCLCVWILEPAIDVTPALQDGEDVAIPEYAPHAKWNEYTGVCHVASRTRAGDLAYSASMINFARQDREREAAARAHR